MHSCLISGYAQTILVGIAGGSGSGKTTLAKKIKAILGNEAIILEQDNYYRDFPELNFEEKTQINFDCPDSVEFPLFVEHLSALKRGEPIEQPLYDFSSYSRTEETKIISPHSIILVEGCLVFTSPELRDLFDLKIFMDVDADLRILRRLERDQTERGRTFDSVKHQYMDTVRPMYIEYVSPTRRYADLTISGEKENDKVLDLLLSLKPIALAATR